MRVGGYLGEGAGGGGVDLAKAAIRKAKPAPRSETRRGCCRCASSASRECRQGRLVPATGKNASIVLVALLLYHCTLPRSTDLCITTTR
jgi:hypothetical protein